MIANLRHLRILAAVAELGSVSKAARQMHVSQPAVTQALSRMEALLGATLFERSPRGLFLTSSGSLLIARINRAFALLDPALADLSPRLRLTATLPQLQALVAVTETESFSEAARRLGLAQPTVYRAITQMESEVGRPLFERSARGVVALRGTRALAIAARLTQAELRQASAELAEISGREVGRIVVGAMPLSRACLLGPAIARFRKRRPNLRLSIIDGPFPELALGLRRGEIDLLLGALRPDGDVPDLRHEPLFSDTMVVDARAGHPLAGASDLSDLAGMPWVVASEGTPARRFFDAMFPADAVPANLIETGSSVLMREVLTATDHLGFTSALQVEHDLRLELLVALPFRPKASRREIGLIHRFDWQPTTAQSDFIEDLRHCAARLPHPLAGS